MDDRIGPSTGAWHAVALVLLFAARSPAQDPGPPAGWTLAREVRSFDRSSFDPAAADLVRRHNSLRPGGDGLTGWIEFDFEVLGTGWYEILVEPDCGLAEYILDGKTFLYGHGGRKEKDSDPGKLDNVWLARGKHVLRVQRNIWWGVWPDVRRVVLRASSAETAKRVRVAYAHGSGDAVLRKGEPLKMTVWSGDLTAPAAFEARLLEPASGRIVSRAGVELPAKPTLTEAAIALPCPEAGDFVTAFALDGKDVSKRDLRQTGVHVVDTTPVPRPGGDLRSTVVAEIDCASREPDFVSGGPTRVVERPFGRYRESGDRGFLAAQHRNSEESWFAYRLSAEPGRPHLLEVDYPDDAERTFLIAIRDSAEGAYPVSSGVDSGGCFSTTGRMQTDTILFWPKSADLRVLLMTPHDGWRAAASKIRLRRVEAEIPPMDVPVEGGRTFLNWYEEGSNFVGFYGGRKGDLASVRPAADNWARALTYMGGNLLMPTVSVYQMNLYPSRYNSSFADDATDDVVRLLLLHAERYGMRFVAEFHPEARELGGAAGPRNALLSKEGKPPGPNECPRYHPLHPATREWLLGLVGEFAERYKDSPALAGVSLRLMSWANPALNNFHSLDWGYDDLTVERFEKETGLTVPVPKDAPDRFARRHIWLTGQAREKWVSWRCDAMTALHREILARLRRARRDLKLFLNVFDLREEAGIDIRRLASIDGIEVIDSPHGYGRRDFTYQGGLSDQANRDGLLDPASLGRLRAITGRSALLFGAGYFEATEKVAPPAKLGWPADMKHGWMSGVANPAGRHMLERYALALAETDALILGDGGNAYTLGQPVLREFLREFRRLPPVPFKPRPDARDPVAVWELARDGDFLFYAVNRERFPVVLTLQVEASGPLRRLATGEAVAAAGDALRLALLPYQLVAFAAPKGAAIRSARVEVPPAALDDAKAKVAFVQRLLEEEKAGGRLEAEGVKRLEAAATEAAKALGEGRIWRARTLLEHHELAERVYRKLGRYPPGLEYLDGVAPENRVVPRDPGRPAIRFPFDRIEGGATPVESSLALSARVEGGCSLKPGLRGQALSLDGKEARVAVEGEGLKALAGGGLTVSAWIRPHRGAERLGLVSWQRDSRGMALLLWNGSLVAEAGDASGLGVCRSPDTLVSFDAWHHVAATVEPGKGIALYLDGVKVQEVGLKNGIGDPGAPMLVGWNGWCGRQNDHSPGPFSGEIDDLKFWTRALTREEIVWVMRER